MKYFDINEDELSLRGGIYTAKEISGQPDTWKKTFEKILKEQNEIQEFWNDISGKCRKIILTGAGTSAYIGYSLEGAFQRHTGITTISVPSTHLVTHPADYFQENVPTLLVSFARSGNSPESVAATKLADKICNECYHLVITCDEEGELAKFKTKNNKYNFILPPESNDKSLAMTSSYTSMLLSGLLISRLGEIEKLREQVDQLVRFGMNILEKYIGIIRGIAQLDFNRCVFLGSGPLYGTATESHLKLQELSDGQIICKSDSFLAFRHGPKAVIDENTIVFFIFSNNEYVRKYEADLVMSMQKGKKAKLLVGVCDKAVFDIKQDVEISMSDNGAHIDEEFLAVCSVLPAQILGFFKSLDLGLKPDNPSVSGAISRVVEGVVIYEEYSKSNK